MRTFKRILVALGIAIVALVLALAGLVAWTFSGRLPLQDGQEIGSARLVKDGFVGLAVLSIGEGEVALVDAGKDADGEALLAELARRGLAPDAVKAILLTHGHSDHTAAVTRFPKAEVMALEADVDLVEGRIRGHSPLASLIPARPTGIRVTRVLQDGETVAVGRLQVRVFAVPGHTSGSAAYLADGVLFLGDSADASSGGLVEGAPWAFSDDPEQNRDALVRLGQRLKQDGAEVKALVFSHSGALVQGLQPLLDFAPAR